MMSFLHVHPYLWPSMSTTVVSNFDIIFRYTLPLQTHISYIYIKTKSLKYFDYTEMSKFCVIFLE